MLGGGGGGFAGAERGWARDGVAVEHVAGTDVGPSRASAGTDYHAGYFRVANNDLYQARAVADFAYNKLGLRRVSTIHDGDPYTSALAAAFGAAFGALGGDVAGTARIEKGDTDMTAALSQFAAAEPDGVFFPLFSSDGTPFARQVQEFDGLEGVTLIAGTASLDSVFLGTPQSEGVYFAGPETDHGGNVNGATGKSAGEVLAAYKACVRRAAGVPVLGARVRRGDAATGGDRGARRYGTTGAS